MTSTIRLFILFLCVASLQDVLGQNEDKIRLSGIVLQLDSIIAVPNASVYIKSANEGVISDQMGLFSLNVSKKDTVVFSAVGYKTTYYIVADSLKSSSYSIIHKMPLDTIPLKVVEITSWPSLEQFNEAFTKEYGFDEDGKTAMNNSSPMLNKIDHSKEINMQNNMEMMGKNYSYVYENAHIPLTSVLNPKRWNKLVSDWKKGKHR